MTVNAPRLVDLSDTPKAQRIWAPTLVSIAIAGVVFGTIFRHEVAGAVKVWLNSTAYTHCFLVLPMIGILLWNRRDVIAMQAPSPSSWPLLLLPLASVAWLGAALLGVLEAEQLISVTMFEILLVAVLGWRVFRALLAPLLFLFFLVPFGAFLVPALQRFTAVFAAQGLELAGIPTFADGLIIQIPEGWFEVAEACAGLRFLIASVVFGCFFSTIVYRSLFRRLSFVVLSLGLPIIANGLRVLGLIILAHIEGSATAMEADHIFYGWLFFALVMLLLIAIGMSFAESSRPRVAPTPDLLRGFSRSRLGATTAAGLVLVAIGPLYLSLAERSAAAPVGAISFGPATAVGWVHSEAISDWRPEAPGADRTTMTSYQKGGASVAEFLAWYRFPVRGSRFMRDVTAVVVPQGWRIVESGREPASIGGLGIAVNTARIARNGKQRLVWWTYAVHGQITGSRLEALLLLVRAGLERRQHIAGLIAVSSELNNSVVDSPALLADFLRILGPLPEQAAAYRAR